MKQISANLRQTVGGQVIASGDLGSDFSYELLDSTNKKIIGTGIGTLTLTNNSDGMIYYDKPINVEAGIISFNLPVLKKSTYLVTVRFNDVIYPSDGSTYIMVEKNPTDAELSVLQPLTADEFLADYVKRAELPDISGLALKTDIPSVTGLASESYVNEQISLHTVPEVDLTGIATELYVNEKIALIDIPDVDLTGVATESYVNEKIALIDIPDVDLTGVATESYVNDQISLLDIPEPVDTSGFLTKPLETPVISTDPATKGYVDLALGSIPTGDGSGGTWTPITSGAFERFEYNAYNYMTANGFSKFKVMVSVNSDADSFLLHLIHGGSVYHVSGGSYNNSTAQILEGSTAENSIKIETGKVLIELEYEFVNKSFLDIGDLNGRLKITITSDTWGILSSYSTTLNSFNYVPNLDRLLTLNGTSFGASYLKVDSFTNFTSKTVKGMFLGYK